MKIIYLFMISIMILGCSNEVNSNEVKSIEKMKNYKCYSRYMIFDDDENFVGYAKFKISSTSKKEADIYAIKEAKKAIFKKHGSYPKNELNLNCREVK